MKVKIIIILFVFPELVHAQLGESVKRQFPVSILSRIYDIASKTALSESQQMQLGKYFSQQDSLAQEALLQGKPMAIIDSYYHPVLTDLYPILSYTQIWDYANSPDVQHNIPVLNALPLYEFLSMKAYLKLTDNQIFKIKEQISHYQDSSFAHISKPYDSKNNLLTAEQYRSYYLKKNEYQAHNQARASIEELKKYGIFHSNDSLRIFNKLLRYELDKRTGIAYSNASGNHKNDERNREKTELSRPMELYYLDGLKQMRMWSKLFNIIYYQKETGLSIRQVYALIGAYLKYRQMEFDNKYNHAQNKLNRGKFENEHLLKILTPQQLDHWLRAKNTDRAEKRTTECLEKLKRYQLRPSVPNEKLKKELFNYQLNLLIAQEKVSINNTRENAFARQDIINSCPEILQQLDQAVEEERKSKIVKF